MRHVPAIPTRPDGATAPYPWKMRRGIAVVAATEDFRVRRTEPARRAHAHPDIRHPLLRSRGYSISASVAEPISPASLPSSACLISIRSAK